MPVGVRRRIDGDCDREIDTLLNETKQTAKELEAKMQMANKSAGNGKWSTTHFTCLSVIAVLAVITRTFLMDHPDKVVFDEVHFGGFASQYLRHSYYFDIHPPLGKLFIAMIGWIAGWDGAFTWPSIGASLRDAQVPWLWMRTCMAFLGCVNIAIFYAVCVEMGCGWVSGLVAALLVVFDGAMTIQNRFLLLDTPMLFFILLAVWGWALFSSKCSKNNANDDKGEDETFGRSWWLSLLLTGIGIGGAVSVKMVGLFVIATIGLQTLGTLWGLIDGRKGNSSLLIFKHVVAMAVCLILVPACVFVGSFWIHFALLRESGPGDAFMSKGFQAALIGNPLWANSRQVYSLQTIRLKNLDNNSLLSSPYKGDEEAGEDHDNSSNHTRYPLNHIDDNKVSSQGPIVGLKVSETNNEEEDDWWIIHVYGPEKMLSGGSGSEGVGNIPIKCGQRIRLQHKQSRSWLYTHNVASALTRTNTEITLKDKEQLESDARDCDKADADAACEKSPFNASIWTLECNGGGYSDSNVYTESTHFSLHHRQEERLLTNQQAPLPAQWNHHGLHEVNGARHPKLSKKKRFDPNKNTQKWTISQIEEAPTPVEAKLAQDRKNKVKIPGFWGKFRESLALQLSTNGKLSSDHPFASNPGEWPFVRRGISYWDEHAPVEGADDQVAASEKGKKRKGRIYFMGNPVGWHTAFFAIILSLSTILLNRGRAHRSVLSLTPVQKQFEQQSAFVICAWAVHWFPFWVMKRTLYLHHYLPCFLFGCLQAALLFNYWLDVGSRRRAAPSPPINNGSIDHRVWSSNGITIGLIPYLIMTIVVLGAFAFYIYLLPITFGIPIATDDLERRRLLDSWDWP